MSKVFAPRGALVKDYVSLLSIAGEHAEVDVLLTGLAYASACAAITATRSARLNFQDSRQGLGNLAKFIV
jgi:hypothetical protein